ncbi:ketol-acid reductoisomerase [Natrinema ejinorense]|uniref:Ketol-acid reductoisomerase (NADP(+)) n=1 Tax=Natrinema ejinorense TaxID=373386 RepID=A0A2A5QQ65_9EURY|nr:ketol-acid reductoisomerase [Natrinema ejinorense]PCR88883.1 ketol-acid reductoisomerase [Natrinema ejinorense]
MADNFSSTVYHEQDADAAALDDETVAVLGYGSQGHAHALNLYDSGVDVVVGLREGSASWEAAEDEGLDVRTVPEAAKAGDIVSILVPDRAHIPVYNQVEDHLEAGDTLQFAHGFSIHYSQIEPPADVNVTMVAPKSPGHLVRRNYNRDQGTPGLLAVYQNVTGDAETKALTYAQKIGCARAGVIKTTFQEEVESDLFGEQAVLCGGVTELIKLGFETLVENGYSPEIAYFECLNELKLIVDLIYEGGLENMWHSVSDTAEFGGLEEGRHIVDDQVRENMQEALERVQTGEFARKWISENQCGRPSYHQLRRADSEHQIESVGEDLRGLYDWNDQ